MRSTTLTLLAPALIVVLVLFLGGLLLAAGQAGPLWGLFADVEFRASVLLTLGVAAVSTALSGVAGLFLALALRRPARKTRWVTALLQAPIVVPHLTLAVMLIQLLGQSGLLARVGFALGWIGEPAGFPPLVHDQLGFSIILAYILKETPFIALMVLALLVRTGDEFDEAARTLGASQWQRLRYVTLPMVAPALVSASLLVFAFVFSAFEVPYLLGRQYPALLAVVAQRKFLDPDLAARPDAMATALLMTMLVALLVWLYMRLARSLVGVDRPMIF